MPRKTPLPVGAPPADPLASMRPRPDAAENRGGGLNQAAVDARVLQ